MRPWVVVVLGMLLLGCSFRVLGEIVYRHLLSRLNLGGCTIVHSLGRVRELTRGHFVYAVVGCFGRMVLVDWFVGRQTCWVVVLVVV